jgi:hypothetical protein
MQTSPKTFTASGAITAFQRVKFSSAGVVTVAGLGEVTIGVALNTAADGALVAVALHNQAGTVTVLSATSFSAGAYLYGAAAGLVDDVANGPALYLALQAAGGANEAIEALPIACILGADGVTLPIANILDFSSATPSTETTGSLITTGTTWINHTAIGSCAVKLLCADAAATGDYATLRMRARCDIADGSAGVNGTVAGNFSASGGINNYKNLFGIQGLAQPNAYTQSGASSIVCGVYSCVDKTATSAGRVWSMWIDDHSTTAKATGGHYLLRMSQNALGGTPVNIDGAITIQASRLPVFMNIETADGFLTDADATLTVQSGAIAVQTPAGTKYIPLYNHA